VHASHRKISLAHRLTGPEYNEGRIPHAVIVASIRFWPPCFLALSPQFRPPPSKETSRSSACSTGLSSVGHATFFLGKGVGISIRKVIDLDIRKGRGPA